MRKSVEAIIIIVLLGILSTSLFAQVIQKKINGNWDNWAYVNGNFIQYAQNNEWVTYLEKSGSVIKLLKRGEWYNHFNIERTTAFEAVNGEWEKRYYPNNGFIQKLVNGQWHNEWKINGNYIQEWNDWSWENMYYMPDGMMDLTIIACILDAGKFKINVSKTSPSNNSSNIPIAGGGGGSPRPNNNSNNNSNNNNSNNNTNNNNNKAETNCLNGYMTDDEFENALSSIKQKTYDDDKTLVAKQIAKTNCMTTKQVKQVMLTMVYDDARLDFAKYAYRYVYDKKNYYMVNDAFKYPSEAENLNKYIMSY